MNGIEILMKNMGVDPAKIMASMQPMIEKTVGVLTAELNAIKETQQRILERVEVNHDHLMALHVKLDKLLAANPLAAAMTLPAFNQALQDAVRVGVVPGPNHDPENLVEGGKLDNA